MRRSGERTDHQMQTDTAISKRKNGKKEERPVSETGMNQRQDRRNLRRVGAGYEHIAGAFLEREGFRILEYNFRCRTGEIDIIAREGDILVFAEVKYRKTKKRGGPFEAVDGRKQYVICRCADYYRITHGVGENCPCRFDVVGILGEDIRLIRNAFDYIPLKRNSFRRK